MITFSPRATAVSCKSRSGIRGPAHRHRARAYRIRGRGVCRDVEIGRQPLCRRITREHRCTLVIRRAQRLLQRLLQVGTVTPCRRPIAPRRAIYTPRQLCRSRLGCVSLSPSAVTSAHSSSMRRRRTLLTWRDLACAASARSATRQLRDGSCINIRIISVDFGEKIERKAHRCVRALGGASCSMNTVSKTKRILPSRSTNPVPASTQISCACSDRKGAAMTPPGHASISGPETKPPYARCEAFRRSSCRASRAIVRGIQLIRQFGSPGFNTERNNSIVEMKGTRFRTGADIARRDHPFH